MADIAPSRIALWKPFSGKGTRPLTHDIVCVHTMVGSLAGSWSWANRPGNAYWHFGTSGTGECWQCHSLRYRSASNLDGNGRIIPIENADMGPGFGPWSGRCGDVPPFTPAQQAKLIDLIEWLCREFDIPPVLVPDSRPGRRGIAYHRQGIDPWRVSGGELWSSSRGKCCPDGARINQLVNVIIPEVARRIRGGPVPQPEDWFDMASKAELEQVVREQVSSLCAPLIAQYDDGRSEVWLVDRAAGVKTHLHTWDAVNAAVVLGARSLGAAEGGKQKTYKLPAAYMDNLTEVTDPRVLSNLTLRAIAIQEQTK